MRPIPSTRRKEIGSLGRGMGRTSFWSIRFVQDCSGGYLEIKVEQTWVAGKEWF